MHCSVQRLRCTIVSSGTFGSWQWFASVFFLVLLTADADKTRLSCLVRVGDVNTTADKTRQFFSSRPSYILLCPFFFFYSTPVEGTVLWSNRLCVCLSVSVCLSASISLEPLDQYSRNFVFRSPVSVARPVAALRYIMYFWFYGWCHIRP